MITRMFWRPRSWIVLLACSIVGATCTIIGVKPYCEDRAIRQALKLELTSVERLNVTAHKELLFLNATMSIKFEPDAVSLPYRWFCPRSVDAVKDWYETGSLARSWLQGGPAEVSFCRSRGCGVEGAVQILKLAKGSPNSFTSLVVMVRPRSEQSIPVRFGLNARFYTGDVDPNRTGWVEVMPSTPVYQKHAWWMSKLPQAAQIWLQEKWFTAPKAKSIELKTGIVDIAPSP